MPFVPWTLGSIPLCHLVTLVPLARRGTVTTNTTTNDESLVVTVAVPKTPKSVDLVGGNLQTLGRLCIKSLKK